MKTKVLLIALMLACSVVSFAQQTCNCETALSKLISKIEHEYPGFADKTSDSLRYDHFKTMISEKAKSTKQSACFELLRDYLGYFNDRHIYISQANRSQNDQEKKKYHSKTDISLKAFNERINNTTDKLEGIWESAAYKVGIIKNRDHYDAFVIDADTTYWKPFEIKFKLLEQGKVKYFMRDHSLFEETYNLYDDCVLYFNNLQSAFVKIQPEPNLTKAQIQLKVDEIEGFYIKKLTEKSTLLSISSFMYNNVERIEKLIANHTSLLENTEHLIIDVRNNGGGTDDGYREILPYICTNPIRMVGAQFLATQGLIDGLQNWMNKLPDEEKYDADRARIKNKIALYSKHLGEFVGSGSKPVYIDTIAPAVRGPSQVIILANRGTASAAESFIYKAKQSKKVKVMGIPTAGVLDYGSARKFDFGCDGYNLSLPTFRSQRLPEYPIDNIGIQPDLYMDQHVKDWIQYALNYLENRSN